MQISPTLSQSQLTSQLHRLAASRWFWCLVAVVFIAVRHLAAPDADPIGPRFGDSDDALRLVQIREFLIHGSWYDTHLPSIGAPEILNSPWSRLIDLPVAWLISFFALFTSYAGGELLAQIVWPLLLLFGLSRFMVMEAERRAGAEAGLFVLALLVLCPFAIAQFLPGRIDHHNAQITCAVISILLLQRALSEPRAGWAAGAVMALGIVIGFEALPLVLAVLAVGCLLACFDKTARPGAVRAAWGLAAGLGAGFAVTVHPGQWTTVECDTLGLNLLALCITGAVAAGLLYHRFRDASPWLWVGGFAVAGGIGSAFYFTIQPACSAGAFTGMDPIVKTEWLAKVIEARPLLQYAEIQPSLAFGFMFMMAIVLTVLIRQAWTTRATADMFIAASVGLASLYGFYYIKFTPYGAMLALVPLACWIARLPAIGETGARSIRMLAVLVCNQALFATIAGVAIGMFSSVEAEADPKLSSGVVSCMGKSDIAALSKLPPGLVIADNDLGSYIALSTRHRAYSGPYHRIHKSIRDVIVLFRSPLPEAASHLKNMNADYLVLCAVPEPGRVMENGEPAADHFSKHMRSGGTFKGLEPVSIGKTEGPLKVWKIVKSEL